MRSENGDRCSAAAYSRTPIPLQFIASICTAQNVCTARLRTSVLTEKRSRALLWPARSRFQALLTAQFRLIFRVILRMLARRVVAREVLQSGIKCVLRQATLTAIFGPRQTAELPRLDVNNPPGIVASHSRNVPNSPDVLHVTKEARPTYCAYAPLNLGAGTDVYTTKGLPHVIGKRRRRQRLLSWPQTGPRLPKNLLSNHAGGG